MDVREILELDTGIEKEAVTKESILNDGKKVILNLMGCHFILSLIDYNQVFIKCLINYSSFG